MKAAAMILLIIFHCICANSQLENDKPGSASEQQLENLTEQQEGEPEDAAPASAGAASQK